jgi:predicted nucleotidyltransferase
MLPSYDKENFKKVCEKFNLSLVILHGSYAKDTVTSKSDIDVGILGEPDIIKERYFEILGDLSEFFGDKFDPLFINGAEPMITYHAAVDGIPLYEKTKGLFNSFKVGAMARYMDTRKFRLLEKQYIKSAIRKAE